jgi:hypothetical protein
MPVVFQKAGSVHRVPLDHSMNCLTKLWVWYVRTELQREALITLDPGITVDVEE